MSYTSTRPRSRSFRRNPAPTAPSAIHVNRQIRLNQRKPSEKLVEDYYEATSDQALGGLGATLRKAISPVPSTVKAALAKAELQRRGVKMMGAGVAAAQLKTLTASKTPAWTGKDAGSARRNAQLAASKAKRDAARAAATSVKTASSSVAPVATQTLSAGAGGASVTTSLPPERPRLDLDLDAELDALDDGAGAIDAEAQTAAPTIVVKPAMSNTAKVGVVAAVLAGAGYLWMNR